MATKKQQSISRETIDLTVTKNFQGVARAYQDSIGQEISRYALTTLIAKYGTMITNAYQFNCKPDFVTITVDVYKKATLYNSVGALLVSGKHFAVIQGYYNSNNNSYCINICGQTQDATSFFDTMLSEEMEKNNFYQGKSLRISQGNLAFIDSPATAEHEAVLEPETKAEIQMNVLDFLIKSNKLTTIKRRGILLYGPPGTGKTTSIRYVFNELRHKNVTCVFISNDSFHGSSVEQIFDLINKYLTPCLIVFEDIDLIAENRQEGISPIIGPLLSALNGIENQSNPIVIMATTNRLDMLDPAIANRPCRFDRKIKIGYPTEKVLMDIFKSIAGFEAPKDIFQQPKSAKNRFTGAHVREIFNTATLIALSKELDVKDCIVEATNIVKKNFFTVNDAGVGFNHNKETKVIEGRVGFRVLPANAENEAYEDASELPDAVEAVEPIPS